MGMVKKVAAYLTKLPEQEYGIPDQVGSIVNYLLDSWFSRIDERANRLKDKPRPFYPDDPDVHIKELWLGCEIHKVISINQNYPPFARNAQAWAFVNMFAPMSPNSEYEIVPFLDQYQFKSMLKSYSSYRIQHSQISIDLGSVVTLPVYGIFFVRNSMRGVNLVVTIDLGYNSHDCIIRVLAPPQHQTAAEEFFQAFQRSLIEHDIYFKKCLSYNSGYLDFAAVKPTQWADVILKEDIKDQIRSNSIGVLDHMEELTSLGMCPNRNTLLMSPPGMAKTTMFRALSNETANKATRIWCTGKSIEYPDHVTSLFEAARTLAPCIIFIEDMDLFGRDRDALRDSDSRVLNEFLACLDGTLANSGIVVLASTNDAACMDSALLQRPGRFNLKIPIPYPDLEDRHKMLHAFLGQLHATPDKTVTPDTIKTVLELCDGLTGDYIKELANSVIIRAVSHGRSANGRVVFCSDDLIAAADQSVKNFEIGNMAKKHITSVDLSTSKSA